MAPKKKVTTPKKKPDSKRLNGKESGKLKNPKWELFSRLYSGSNKEFFGNATRCYKHAFGYDERWWDAEEARKEFAYGSNEYRAQKKIQAGIDKTCSVEGCRLLGIPSVQKRCDELLDETLVDVKVDRERARVIKQNSDFSSKIRAIESYDKVKNRVKGGGELSGEIIVKWED